MHSTEQPGLRRWRDPESPGRSRWPEWTTAGPEYGRPFVRISAAADVVSGPGGSPVGGDAPWAAVPRSRGRPRAEVVRAPERRLRRFEPTRVRLFPHPTTRRLPATAL